MTGRLSVLEEVLYRQIHPNSLQGGVPASDRFRPAPMDDNMLSTDRGSLITPEAAHQLFTSSGAMSAAVFGLTVGEFGTEEIQCLEDPVKDDPRRPDNAAHALADYSAHDLKKQKLIAKRLLKLAVTRGCLHPVE